MSIYIDLVLVFILVLVLVIVILLHFYSVLVLVIVTKISLSIAILLYALVSDDYDEDDAGLSSGAGTNFKKVGGTCQTRSARKFFCRALHFFGFIYLFIFCELRTEYTHIKTLKKIKSSLYNNTPTAV